MLTITIPEQEYFDESTNDFIHVDAQTLVLEHSLAAIAEWESKWKVSFLSTEEKSSEQVMDYINCMLIDRTKNVTYIDNDSMQKIANYISDPMTATTINNRKNKSRGREIITAELIYYWMTALSIPFECQYWHLNRLMMLINVCSLKQQDPEKMSKKDAFKQQSDLNALRRAKMKTKG